VNEDDAERKIVLWMTKAVANAANDALIGYCDEGPSEGWKSSELSTAGIIFEEAMKKAWP
jgi:hypothetical protein